MSDPAQAGSLPDRWWRLPAWLLIGLSLAFPAASQDVTYGRWWWDAILRAESHDYDTETDGQRTGGLEENEVRLALGLNGFLFDPALGQFRIGVETRLSSFGDVEQNDSTRLSYEGIFRIFPQGAYVIDLFARQFRYDYSELSADPFRRTRLTESSTSWGSRLRVRRGPLRGIHAGIERNRIGFFGLESGSELEEREFVDWSRAEGRFRRHFRVERSLRDLTALDYQTRDLSFDFDQGGRLTAKWDWNFFLRSLRRRLMLAAAPEIAIDHVRLHNNLTRTTARDNLVSLSYRGSFLRSGTDRFSHVVRGRYVLRHWRHWQVAPFAAFALQQLPDVTITVPQLGASATWQRHVGAFDLSFTQGLSYLLQQYSGEAAGDDLSSVASSSGFSLGHGEESALRKELELAVDLNRLREVTETIAELPDLGVGLNQSSNEDRQRARLTLRRRWQRLRVDVYSEWTRQVSSRRRMAEDFVITGMRHSLTLSGGRFSVAFNADEIDAELPDEAAQTIEALSASLTLRPWRFLSLTSSYRVDERRLNFGPDIDGERSEVTAELRFGAFMVEATMLRNVERILDGREQVNMGLRWTISRRFGGWLPVVTGARAKGQVR